MDNEQRTWGDGGGKNRRHEIARLDFVRGLIICAIDDEVVHFGTIPADAAWDLHRGLELGTVASVVRQRSIMAANDDEVSSFLLRLSGSSGGTNPRAAQRDPSAVGSEDLTSAFALLDRLAGLEESCTCGDGSSIWVCPNYVEGDEALIGE